MFEYKVRARHKLGWKEFKLYADTDIEEFFNRKSIEYVRNMTDTIENKQQQEIERLNNIMKEAYSTIDYLYSNYYRLMSERGHDKDFERLLEILKGGDKQ